MAVYGAHYLHPPFDETEGREIISKALEYANSLFSDHLVKSEVWFHPDAQGYGVKILFRGKLTVHIADQPLSHLELSETRDLEGSYLVAGHTPSHGTSKELARRIFRSVELRVEDLLELTERTTLGETERLAHWGTRVAVKLTWNPSVLSVRIGGQFNYQSKEIEETMEHDREARLISGKRVGSLIPTLDDSSFEAALSRLRISQPPAPAPTMPQQATSTDLTSNVSPFGRLGNGVSVLQAPSLAFQPLGRAPLSTFNSPAKSATPSARAATPEELAKNPALVRDMEKMRIPGQIYAWLASRGRGSSFGQPPTPPMTPPPQMKRVKE